MQECKVYITLQSCNLAFLILGGTYESCLLYTSIPEDMQDEAELYHDELVEKICELDDDLTMMYLEGEEPSVEQLKACLLYTSRCV